MTPSSSLPHLQPPWRLPALLVLWAMLLGGIALAGENAAGSSTEQRPVASFEIDWLPAVLSESIQACRVVQEAADLPIRCTLRYVRARKTLAITFPDTDAMRAHILTIAERIVFPFCQFTQQQQQRYLMFFIITQSNTGNLYSCAHDRFSGWFKLSALEQSP